jgi:hypothetical protein
MKLGLLRLSISSRGMHLTFHVLTEFCLQVSVSAYTLFFKRATPAGVAAAQAPPVAGVKQR